MCWFLRVAQPQAACGQWPVERILTVAYRRRRRRGTTARASGSLFEVDHHYIMANICTERGRDGGGKEVKK